MKVSDVMQKEVDFVTTKSTVSDVARLIFGRGINGVPVCRDKKVIGFVTEKDILAKFYPTMREYMDDPVHSADFVGLEKKTSEILEMPAEEVMSNDPVIVGADTPILEAQSLMVVRGVGRLPVVDGQGNLIGILSKGDIFRVVVGEKLPYEEEEKFYDWMSKFYDVFIDWGKRLKVELSSVTPLLRKNNAVNILDFASSTGEHAISLAKSGFTVYGLDTSSLICELAESKKEKLSGAIKNKLHFLSGNYQDTIKKIPKNVDAAVFMGNALSHVLYTDKNILKEVVNILNPKRSVLVFQILNLKKLFGVHSGFREFIIRKSKKPYNHRHAFLAFYTKEKGKTIKYNFAVFDPINGSSWIPRGMRSTTIIGIYQSDILSMLKKLGFSDIKFYGSSYYEPLFSLPFRPLVSDWLNVIATR